MRILQLGKLQPGDIILERGIEAIADATGGRFGHASVALGRLVKIEAGKDDGVVLSPFEFSAYRRGKERIVGLPVMEPDLDVMRHRYPPELGTLYGRSLLEAGRAYSLAKALELPDLDAQSRKFLARKLETRGVAVNSEGRICSEVAARILGLSDKIVSPNMLTSAPDLYKVEDAVIEIGEDWAVDPTQTAGEAVGNMVAKIELGLAERAMHHAKQGAAAVKLGVGTTDAVANSIEAALNAELEKSIGLLRDIEVLEQTVLHTGIEPI